MMCFRPVQRAHRFGRHLRVVVEDEVVSGGQARQFLRLDFATLITSMGGSVGRTT